MLQTGKSRCGDIIVSPQAADSYAAAVNNDFHFIRKESDRTGLQQQSKNKDHTPHKRQAPVILIKLAYLPHHDECREACVSSFSLRASLTVEAAIALPLFIFMMFILVFPLKVMEEERRIQNTAEGVGRQFAAAEYVKDIGEELLNKDGDSNEYLQTIAGGIEEGAALGIILAKAMSFKSINMPYFGDDTAVFSGDSEDMFKVRLLYEIELPFSTYTISSLSRSIIVSRRAWTGSDGGRGRSKYSGDEGDGEDEPERRVYLGKTSTVYHEDPNCHYLSNVMQTADASHMEALRNESGGKYHACPSCKPGKSGTVYYFGSGTAYHSSEHCKAITAYSRSVPLSEVGDMRACSYCGKSH